MPKSAKRHTPVRDFELEKVAYLKSLRLFKHDREIADCLRIKRSVAYKLLRQAWKSGKLVATLVVPRQRRQQAANACYPATQELNALLERLHKRETFPRVPDILVLPSG